MLPSTNSHLWSGRWSFRRAYTAECNHLRWTDNDPVPEGKGTWLPVILTGKLTTEAPMNGGDNEPVHERLYGLTAYCCLQLIPCCLRRAAGARWGEGGHHLLHAGVVCQQPSPRRKSHRAACAQAERQDHRVPSSTGSAPSTGSTDSSAPPPTAGLSGYLAAQGGWQVHWGACRQPDDGALLLCLDAAMLA